MAVLWRVSLWCSCTLLFAYQASSFAVGETTRTQQVCNSRRRSVPMPRQILASTTQAHEVSTATIKREDGVSKIVDQFDTFLLDMWGVMHDGSTPYEGVLDVVKRLRKAGKKLVILSNSSKRRDNSVKMLKKLGFDPDDFDQIITSGEVAFQMLSNEIQLWDVLDQLQRDSAKKKVLVLGSGDQDEEYCESAGWSLAPVEEASLIVARGTFTVNDGTTLVSKRDNPEMYNAALEAQLQTAAIRKIPMLVTNPDKIRPDVERPPMPGKIGDRYVQLLRQAATDDDDCEALVKRVGKPFQDVYNIAINDAQDENRRRVCMIGDALETDIVGGAVNGIPSVWVLMDGIYGPDLAGHDGAALMEQAHTIACEFNKESGTYANGRQVMPELALRHFRW